MVGGGAWCGKWWGLRGRGSSCTGGLSCRDQKGGRRPCCTSAQTHAASWRTNLPPHPPHTHLRVAQVLVGLGGLAPRRAVVGQRRQGGDLANQAHHLLVLHLPTLVDVLASQSRVLRRRQASKAGGRAGRQGRRGSAALAAGRCPLFFLAPTAPFPHTHLLGVQRGQGAEAGEDGAHGVGVVGQRRDRLLHRHRQGCAGGGQAAAAVARCEASATAPAAALLISTQKGGTSSGVPAWWWP
jgi:hypothetical protein